MDGFITIIYEFLLQIRVLLWCPWIYSEALELWSNSGKRCPAK